MGILVDLTLPGGMTFCSVYCSPRFISANRDAGHYALDFMVEKGGVSLPIPPDFSIFEFKRDAPDKPDSRKRAGVIYDRDLPAHAQVYADLAAKVEAGQIPWLTNLRNEDGTPFAEAIKAERSKADA